MFMRLNKNMNIHDRYAIDLYLIEFHVETVRVCTPRLVASPLIDQVV